MDIGTAKLPGGRAARHPAPPARPARRHRAADGRGVPGLGARGDRRHARSRRGRRCWSAARRSTPGRCSTGSSSPAPIPTYAASSRPSSAEVGAAGAAPPARRGATRRRRRGSCPTTAAGSSARSRSSRSPAGRSAPRLPEHEYADPRTRPDRRRHRPADPRPADRAAGARRCSTPASSTRYAACSTPGSREGRTARTGDRLPRGGGVPRRRDDPRRGDRARPPPRPGASRGGRTAGSARTRASSGSVGRPGPGRAGGGSRPGPGLTRPSEGCPGSGAGRLRLSGEQPRQLQGRLLVGGRVDHRPAVALGMEQPVRQHP